MPDIKIDQWKGLGTRWGRSVRPLGFLDDVLNAVLNKKTNKLITRSGYVIDTAQPYTDVSGNTVLTTLSSPNGEFYCATESPESIDMPVLAGKTAGGTTHFFQKPFYHLSATGTSSWLDWGESKTLTGLTLSGASLTATNAGQGNDYYKGWLIWNSTRSQGLYCTGYVLSTKILTVTPQIPSGWSSGDTIVAYRHFHDNPGYVPFWVRPVVKKQGNGIIASGGQSTNVGAKLIHSEYVNKVYPFTGTPITHQETYVDEAEIKTGNAVSVPNFSAGTPGADYLDQGYYSMAYCLETDDGQRGPLIRVNEVNVSVANTNQVTLASVASVSFALLNKRIRYIHWFASRNTASTATPDWSTYFWYGQSDFLAATDFSFTETSGATIGYWSVVGSGIGTGNSALSGSKWNGRGGDAVSFLGYTEPTSTTLSCDYLEFFDGQLVAAKYYDYAEGLNHNDDIRYSPFGGNGAPMYNVLPNIGDVTQSTISSGDPNAITGLKANETYLFVVKTRGIYYILTQSGISNANLQEISKEAGSDAPNALTVTPFGIIFAKSGEDIYIYRGGKQESLMQNFLADYRAISGTYSNQWVGWYDPVNKSYRIMITTDGSTLTTVYEIFLDILVEAAGGFLQADVVSRVGVFAFPISKHQLAHGVSGVTKKSDGTVYFNTTTGTFFFSPLSTTDGETTAGDGLGTKIPLYFKIDGIVVDEKDLVAPTRWYLANEQTGTPANQLDVKISVDGTQIANPTNITKTLVFMSAGLAQKNGRKISFEFNTNATKATWPSLTINEIGFEVETRRIVGDMKQSL